ncbi:hypothetical protein GF373_09705 [bacterium]|nr:hypothetical protein [bacterium]
MARGKKGRKPVAKTQAKEEPRKKNISKEQPKIRQRFTFLDYIIVSVFFVAFCFLQKFIALQMLGETSLVDQDFEQTSLDFFFGTMWKGFLIVAFLAWLIDFFSKDVEEVDTT